MPIRAPPSPRRDAAITCFEPRATCACCWGPAASAHCPTRSASLPRGGGSSICRTAYSSCVSARGRRPFAERSPSLADRAQLDEQAAVLYDVDSRAGESLRRGVVADAELEPDRRRSLRDDVVDVRVDVARAAEDV